MKRQTPNRDKRIVVIGGGTGIFPVLTGLKNYTHNLSAIVTMADEGGSTGILREEFGILPPGDIRRALIALAPSDQAILAKLFNYRFREGRGLAGHAFGNLMITALERITGSFERAIAEVEKILRTRGRVIPVTLKSTRLYARLQNNTVIRGETNIDIPKHNPALRIKDVWLKPTADLNPVARRAILAADAIVIGPGDLYTSVVPNLIVRGMRETLAKTTASVIYVVNVLTKFGETNDYHAADFVDVIKRYAGNDALDYVVVNKTKPSLAQLKPYLAEHAALVRMNGDRFSEKPTPVLADLIRRKDLIRHDAEKIAKVIMSLI